MTLENKAQLTPSLAIGLRHDAGHAETGFGLDLGGGIVWAVPAHRLAAEVNGRWLVVHRDDDFREWGLSG